MSGIPAGAGSLLGKRLGKYEILALLALGGTAEIYLARIGGAAGFEKYVVIKCLHDHLADDAEFVKMFLDEARLAAHLDHSNIVQTMELGEYENRYYMVMEFLAGLSLAMMVRRAGERLPGGFLPVPLVLNVLAQAAAGLHYAHEKTMNGKALNVVHRDISPQNLVVSFEGVVKLVDFGIAKAELRETRTRSGTIKGKFAYMSPEQCVANNVDRRTDVFALGVIGHELLTGKRLFKKPSPYETYQAVIECKIDPPSKLNPDLDPELDPVIMRAVAKDKEQRYGTAEAFSDALVGYLHHRGKGSGPGEVARFFDTTFAQELEDHGARMRELIAGRPQTVETGEDWMESVAGPGEERPSSVSLESIDLLEVPGDGRTDDDELPAEKTRIETNPLDRFERLDPPPPRAASAPPSGALPLPPAPTGRSQTSPPVVARAPSGRFPDPANVATMIAPEALPEKRPEPARPDLARTMLSDDPNAFGGDTVLSDPHAAALAHTVVTAHPSPLVPARPMMQPVAPEPTFAPRLPPAGSGPTLIQPSGAVALPTGYPVMNAELSAQMAAGATVFPSGGFAADVASPVGPQYPHQVDWAAAAAAPAKVVPPWKLALVFIGTIGLALLLTFAIARLVR